MMSHSKKAKPPADAFNCRIEDLKWHTPGVDKLIDRMMRRGLLKAGPGSSSLEDARSRGRVEAWARKLADEDRRKLNK